MTTTPRTVAAESLATTDRLDSARKTRVALVHVRGDKVLVRIHTRGTRSPSIVTYDLGQQVRVY